MTYTAKDFTSPSEVKWCPGCGDHAILKHFQSALAKSGVFPFQTAVISGIGCSSRLPYYMNTYGFHTIHGRALPIATGLKLSRPELNVWVITGDGDSLSIGGNHYIHFFRRNIDVNILLFNNHIYGLTKGQYSPTSSLHQLSKSSPYGTIEEPVNAIHLALSTGASFVCRTFDRDAANIQNYIIEAQSHKGSAIIEILQNCPIFNDAIFDVLTNKTTQAANIIRLVHGMPLKFGENEELTIVMDGFEPKITPISSVTNDSLWIHDESSLSKALILSKLGIGVYAEFPTAFGVIYKQEYKYKKKEYNTYEKILEKTLFENKVE